jgi:DNA-binding response OmpR family regulator
MNRDGDSESGIPMDGQAQPGPKGRVAVFAGDTYTRMRRLQTVRALGLDPRPYSRLLDLLLALGIGRRFQLIVAVLDGSAAEALDNAAALRAAAAPGTPILLLRASESDDADVSAQRALSHDFLLAPFSEEELRQRMSELLAADNEDVPATEQHEQEAAALLSADRTLKAGRKLVRPRIALLEDSIDEAKAFIDLLNAHDCDVLHQRSAGDFLDMLRHESFDLLVLDWNLPGMTGFEVLRELRSGDWARVPVLMLTARNGELETVQALEGGADDFLSKPCRPYELVARIRVLTRPSRAQAYSSVETHFGFEFDTQRQTVHGHGRALTLPSKEFNVALLLFRQAGRPLSRAHLQQAVWHGQSTSGRTIDTHVSRLRAKLGLTRENGFRLQSIHGIGYRLERIDELEDAVPSPTLLIESAT